MVDTAVVVGTLVVAGGRRSSSTVVGGAALQAEEGGEGGKKRKGNQQTKKQQADAPDRKQRLIRGGAPFIARPNESHPSIFKVELLKIQGLLNTHVKKKKEKQKKDIPLKRL